MYRCNKINPILKRLNTGDEKWWPYDKSSENGHGRWLSQDWRSRRFRYVFVEIGGASSNISSFPTAKLLIRTYYVNASTV